MDINISTSSVANILMERGHVHDVAPGDAVLSTPQDRVEDKVLWSKVLLHSPHAGGSWSSRQAFPFLVETSV